MKFIIAVVMLAVAVSIQASPIGPVLEVSHWGGHHPGAVVDNGNWGGNWGNGGEWGGSWDGSWGSGSPHGAPHISLNQGHGHGGVSVGDHGHGHDGKYVAANRGSVHVAPLVGHIQSVSSKNLEPAPGTTW